MNEKTRDEIENKKKFNAFFGIDESPQNPKRKPTKVNDRILSVDIDKSKIVKGQMPYVLKLMKMAKEKAFEDGYKLGSKQKGDVHFNLGKKERTAEILKMLNLCPVCKGTHGQWIRKDELLNLISIDKEKQ